MDIGNKLLLQSEFETEEQALEAALNLGDFLEQHEKVEEWSINYELCPNCGNHVTLVGQVETFFSGPDLVAVGTELGKRTESLQGFMIGDMKPV